MKSLAALALALALCACASQPTTRIQTETVTQVRYAPIPANLTAPMTLPVYPQGRHLSAQDLDEEIARLEAVIVSGNGRFSDIVKLAGKIVAAAPAPPATK